MIRIETKQQVFEFLKKLEIYLKQDEILKTHHFKTFTFNGANQLCAITISIFPQGINDNLFQDEGKEIVYTIQFWEKNWANNERIIIFALWSSKKADKFQNFSQEKINWTKKTQSNNSYLARKKQAIDLHPSSIPNKLINLPYEIDENQIFPIIKETFLKFYNDFNVKLNELFEENQTDKHQQIVDTYIDYYENKDNKFHESYKWQTIKFFQKKWQPNIDNEEFKNLLYEILEIQTNLMSWQNKDNLKKIPADYFEQLKQILNYIFDENIDIQERYKYFKTQIEDISAQLNKELKLNEDIFALFLTCRYPEKYYFYRFEYYKDFCNFIGEKHVSKKDTSGEKYFHYLKIIQYLNDKYVKNNQKIQDITNEFLSKKGLKIFDNKNILTQNIIWISFGQNEIDLYKSEKIESMKNNDIAIPLNQILFGPPGTGKTYHTIDKSVEIVNNKRYKEIITIKDKKEQRKELKIEFKTLKGNGQILFATFHQSMSYEEFVEGLKPFVKDEKVIYKIDNGIFKRICEKAGENPTQNYVLIIDEINRGNIASIFGELITLIEPDKRKNEDEELNVTLPYSKNEFTVPKNLFIIGTMNTADRSVEALDSALRRRFVFEEMSPNEKLLDADFYNINLQKVLKHINVRIEKLIDKDHKIGHSYFMKLTEISDLKNAFKSKLIPLLEEYFYGDFAKIGLILGKDFMFKENTDENIFKTIDSEEDYTDFESRIIYKITVPKSETEFINAVKNIYL